MPIVAHRRRERWIRRVQAADRETTRDLLPGPLAAETLRLLRRPDDPGSVPSAWSDAAFIREVGLVRAHLAPIRSRPMLESSFSREAFHGFAAVDADEPPGPIRVAYAIRWLELGDGQARPAWPDDQTVATPGA